MSSVQKYFSGINPNWVAVARILSAILSYYLGYFTAKNPDWAVHMGAAAVAVNTFLNIFLTQKIDPVKEKE